MEKAISKDLVFASEEDEEKVFENINQIKGNPRFTKADKLCFNSNKTNGTEKIIKKGPLLF